MVSEEAVVLGFGDELLEVCRKVLEEGSDEVTLLFLHSRSLQKSLNGLSSSTKP